MAEIKSTLDLVMEKTKNLSLSSEERAAHKNRDIENRIRGLLQKFKDGALNADKFKSEYQKLRKDFDLSENTHLIKEICGQIEFGEDNRAMFELLAEFEVADIEGLTSVLQKFQTRLETAAGQRREALKAHLAETHLISGSAVVPNLENDDRWRKTAGEIRSEFEMKLSQAKAKLLA